jgi:ribosome-associated toxin RatA of RatAB toxin-antitoxin module
MPGASRSVIINAAMEKVFSVITDYEKYSQFLPEVKRISISDREGNKVQVHYELELIKTIRYTLQLEEQPPRKVSWSLVKGEWMRQNQGAWTLEPVGPTRTQATYSIEMVLGPLVPRSVVNALVDTSLPRMLEAFKRRVETLHPS